LLNVLPFRGLMDVPFRIWTGHIPPEAVFANLASVFVWIGVLVFAGRALIARGVRKLVVQGG
jgi:ABC-2 type transport system permease protein